MQTEACGFEKLIELEGFSWKTSSINDHIEVFCKVDRDIYLLHIVILVNVEF